jgi:hypothetical protein
VRDPSAWRETPLPGERPLTPAPSPRPPPRSFEGCRCTNKAEGCTYACDGQQIYEAVQQQRVALCPREGCGGIVKPDIVFFGEQVGESRRREPAERAVGESRRREPAERAGRQPSESRWRPVEDSHGEASREQVGGGHGSPPLPRHGIPTRNPDTKSRHAALAAAAARALPRLSTGSLTAL